MTQYSGKIIRKTPVVPTQTSASGVWTTADAAAAVKNNTWPVPGVPDPISRSLRFRASASAYLSRTPASAGSRTVFSVSAWIKAGSSDIRVLDTGDGTSNNTTRIVIASSSSLNIVNISGGSVNLEKVSTRVFRDPSAWGHLLVTFNSGTVKAYWNNEEITSWSTNTNTLGSSNTMVNATNAHYINRASYTAAYGDFYTTEYNFIDGQALTPSSFGTTNTLTGAWIPMPYTGTYGTNGFYLNFKDNTSTTTLGYDYSGNSNNWTANNISLTSGTTYDSMLDVPTPWVGYNTGDTSAVTRGNYAVMNPLEKAPNNYTFSDGNLAVSGAGAGSFGAGSTISVSSGKWYWEQTITAKAATDSANAGIRDISANSSATGAFNGGVAGSYIYRSDAFKRNNGTATAYGATFTTNDVIGVALDLDAGTLTFYKNGTSQGTAYSGLAGTFEPMGSGDQSSGTTSYAFNFGQRPFSYSVPSGYKALCTTNLPTPTIPNGANYMAATLYTGNASTNTISNAVNGVSFQPDLIWTKRRNVTNSHQIFDSVRGVTAKLSSDTTAAETSAEGQLVSINSNGFSLGNNAYVNSSPDTFVAWQWQAGAGTTSSNTNGSITSTVGVSTTAGFSVVTYTGNGSSTASVGHGLGVAPKMILIKSRSSVTDWNVYNANLTTPNDQFLRLNTTDTPSTASGIFSTPTSTVFGFATAYASTNANGVTYVAYCFAAVAGFSAFGKYTGNGSTDGPFVYTGFRPRFVMIKNTTNAQPWIIVDTSRNTYNQAGDYLEPNSSVAENGGSAVSTATADDILSNGFKLRNNASSSGYTNANGDSYIYAAFAENPFNYSNAR